MAGINTLKIGAPKLKRFAVDGDESRVIEIDPGDTGIVARWAAVESWFRETEQTLDGINVEDGNEAQAREFAALYARIDEEAREKVNYLFASDVCTPVAGPTGSMMRTVDGQPLFMVVLDALLPLYEAEVRKEQEKTDARIKKHTAKYVK